MHFCVHLILVQGYNLFLKRQIKANYEIKCFKEKINLLFNIVTVLSPQGRFSYVRTLWLVWVVLFKAAVNVDCPQAIALLPWFKFKPRTRWEPSHGPSKLGTKYKCFGLTKIGSFIVTRSKLGCLL